MARPVVARPHPAQTVSLAGRRTRTDGSASAAWLTLPRTTRYVGSRLVCLPTVGLNQGPGEAPHESELVAGTGRLGAPRQHGRDRRRRDADRLRVAVCARQPDRQRPERSRRRRGRDGPDDHARPPSARRDVLGGRPARGQLQRPQPPAGGRPLRRRSRAQRCADADRRPGVRRTRRAAPGGRHARPDLRQSRHASALRQPRGDGGDGERRAAYRAARRLRRSRRQLHVGHLGGRQGRDLYARDADELVLGLDLPGRRAQRHAQPVTRRHVPQRRDPRHGPNGDGRGGR